jgi:hypothetical protein
MLNATEQTRLKEIKTRLTKMRAVTVGAISRCLERQSEIADLAKSSAILDSQIQAALFDLDKFDSDLAEVRLAVAAVKTGFPEP